MVRLELAENQLKGSELVHLKKYADSLEVLKLAANRIQQLKDLDPLGSLKNLKNLDLENNDVVKQDGYKDYVWKLIPSLEVLDNFNKAGEEVFSDAFDDYGEEGEDDLIDDLSEGQLAELKKRGITPEEFLRGGGDFYDEEGEDDFEGGEDDYDDFEDSSDSEAENFASKNANKRAKN